MKKIVCTILAFVSLAVSVFSSPFKVGAENYSYACATNPDTYFYSSSDEATGLFVIPQTYYVKVISKGEKFSYVQYLENIADYKAVFGYCLTDELLFVDFIPERPYLYLTVGVTYTIDGYEPAFSENGVIFSVNYDCVYYGDYKTGSSYYAYVLIDGKFGYIPKPNKIEYETNSDYIKDTVNPSDDPPDIPSTDEEDNSNTPLIVICVICAGLVALGIIVVAVKPDKSKRYYYDD